MMDTHTKARIGIIAVAIIVVGIVLVMMRPQTPAVQPPAPIATASYLCNAGTTITAAYYRGGPTPTPAPGQPPTPTGSVALTLSDGRTMMLAQTISADGGGGGRPPDAELFFFYGNSSEGREGGREK